MTTMADKQTETLVGTWTATSTINGEPAPYSTTFVFSADHTLSVAGPADAAGSSAFTGTGHWIGCADGSFLYDVTHALPDGAGGSIGTIYNLQRVVLDGDIHYASGGAVLHGVDGSIQPAIPVSSTATR
jgi:hypothetical protein